ncbi:MAG: hypothetical protein WCT03_07265 [Candidatus Obscuribacterales bacterium]
MIVKTISFSLVLLVLAAVSFSAAEARGFGGMRGFSGVRGLGGIRAGRCALSGGIRLGRGRGGRRYGYNSTANQGPTIEQQQASYFQERSAQNPYANVPERVNVSDYIRSYR